jgi:CHAD domain-containing protein
MRDHIGADLYREANVAIRDAARLVAPVRDAQVLIKTLDNTVSGSDGTLDARTFNDTRRALKAAHGRLRQRLLYRGIATEQAGAGLATVQQRSHDWPLGNVIFDDLRPGLARVYRRGRRAMERAYNDPSPQQFHEWRKQVKYLWHHLELLQPAWPGLLAALADETHDLSDLLGDEHDRTVLEEHLCARPDMVTDPDAGRLLTAALSEQREHLRAAARPLGARIYAETADQFTKRLAGYWNAGRDAA